MDGTFNPKPSHWAGFDLAKATFQLGRWGHEEEIRNLDVAGFDRTQKGCKAALKLLRREADRVPGSGVRAE